MLVRPEINIAKFASVLFPARSSTEIKKTRKISWEVKNPSGNTTICSLRISPSEGFEAPSTTTYTILLALFEIWKENHSEDGSCRTSSRQILKYLNLTDGGENMAWVEQSLLSLRETSIYWERSFLDNAQKVREAVSFTVLSKLEFISDDNENNKYSLRVRYGFDENIQRNIESNRTKPFSIDVLKSIKGGYAQALYLKLDVLMSSKLKHSKAHECRYERLSANLFEKDLGICLGGKYRYKSRRKEKLETLISKLNGKLISGGAILKLNLRESKDQSDWKLCVALIQGSRSRIKPTLPVVNNSAVVKYLVEDIYQGIRATDFENNLELYQLLCRSYPKDLIYQALSEFKADIGDSARHRGKAFVFILRRLVLDHGLKWLK